VAERLESLDDTIARIISSRSGMALEDVRAAMDAETWYRAVDAVDAGLADEVVETGQRTAASVDRTLLSRYLHVPADVLERGKSHAADTIPASEGRPFVLGNRVYRKKEQ